MSICPKCHVELNEADLQAGLCPSCGTAFQLAEDGSPTVSTPADGKTTIDGRAVSATVDGTDFEVDESGEEPSAAQPGDLRQTVDSADVPDASPPGKATIDGRAISSTVDGTDFEMDSGEEPSAAQPGDPRQTVDSVEVPGSPPPGKATIDGRAISSTVDGTDFDVTDSGEQSSGARPGDPRQTVDSVDSPDSSPPGKATIDGRAISSTVDGGDFDFDAGDESSPAEQSADLGKTLDADQPPTAPPGKATIEGRAISSTVDGTAFDADTGQQPPAAQPPGDLPPGKSTIDSRAAQATIDSSSLPKEPGADQPISRTVDSVDFPAPPPADGKSTVDERAASGTIDSTSFSLGDDQEAAAGRIDQTLDSTDQPPGGVKDGKLTVDQLHKSPTVDGTGVSMGGADNGQTAGDVAQTVDSVDLDDAKKDDGQGTVSDRSVSQTVDTGSGQQRTEDTTVPQRRTQGTVDAASLQTPGATAEDPGTVKSRQFLATYDSAEVSSGEAKRMNDMWGGAAVEKASPRMTIRGYEPQIVGTGTSSLVIQRRGFRDADETQTVGADYDLLRKLGQGGMGVVYSARQASIDRTVAVKMLRSETSSDEQQRNKFLSEAVITGDLDHPNIVPIYDLGKNDVGALFYAMKQVKGTPWDECIGEMSLSENVETLMKVCDAVAFAHSRGFIHRDLKPENTMLGGFGEVLVMDWGLSLPYGDLPKSRAIMPQAGMGGTPAYMAPEMATGPFDKMGPASDIYLLGAILFEVITGKPPHTGKDVMKCLFAAAKNEIVPTQKSGELLDIARKAMATKPEDRYPGVQELQDAIRAYQEHSESIAMASRAQDELDEATESDDYERYNKSLFGFQEALALWEGNEKASKGVSRSKLVYATSALKKGDLDLASSLVDVEDPQHEELAVRIEDAKREREARQHRLERARRVRNILITTTSVVIVVALAVVSFFWNQAEQQRQLAEHNEAEARKQRASAIEQRGIAEDQREKAELNAAEAVRQKGRAEDNARIAQLNEDEALKQKSRAEDNARIAKLNEEEAIKQQGIAEQQRDRAEYEAYVALIGLAAAKIDENAFVDARQLLLSPVCKPELRSWEWGRLMHLCSQSIGNYDPGAPIETVAFDADGKRFATGGWDGVSTIRDAATGEELVRLDIEAFEGLYIYGVAFSPDGKYLVTGSNDPGSFVRVWDAATGKALDSSALAGHTDAVSSVTFSPSGRWLLTTSFDNTARLWDVSDLRNPVPAAVPILKGHNWWVWDAAFSPDESSIVTVSQDGTAVVWDRETGEKLPPFTGHQGPVYSAAFTPDGQQIVTGGYDNRVLLWRPGDLEEFDYETLLEGGQPTPPRFRALDGHAAAVRGVATVQAGSHILVLSAGHDNSIKLWDAQSLSLLQTMRGHGSWVRSCAFSPDAKWVLSGGYDETDPVKLWNIEGYEEVRVLRGRVLEGHIDAIMSAAFSGDGARIVTASRDRTAKTWLFETGEEDVSFEEGHAFLASDAAFFPDGRRLATSAVDNTVRVWNIATGVEVYQLNFTGRAAALAVSHDGKWILTGSSDPGELPTDPLRRPPRDQRKAKLWNAQTGTLAGELAGAHNSEVSAVAFSSDDRYLVTGDMSGRLVLWDRESGGELRRLSWHTSKIAAAHFTPDGQWLLTASDDKTVAQWTVASLSEDPESVQPDESRILKHPDSVLSLRLSGDGQHALTSCVDGTVRLWDVNRAEVTSQLSFEPGQIAAALSPSGLIALTVHPDQKQVRVWDLQTRKEIFDLPAGGLVWTAVFSNDGNSVVTVGGAEARLLDLRTESPNRELMTFSPHASVASANFSPDGTLVVTASWDNSAKIWDAETGMAVRKLTGAHNGYVNSAAFSPDSSLVLTASDDATAVLWNAGTGEVVRRFVGHAARIRSARFSRDGSFIVTASDDKTARIWDVNDGSQPLLTLEGHAWAVLSAVFSEDGQRVITGSEDSSARIWNAQTGELVQTLAGHTAAVTSVAFSPDGLRALTASADFTAKLWDTAPERAAENQNAKEILNLRAHTQEVTSVDFSSDGRYALTGSRDGTAIVWLTVDWTAFAETEQLARRGP